MDISIKIDNEVYTLEELNIDKKLLINFMKTEFKIKTKRDFDLANKLKFDISTKFPDIIKNGHSYLLEDLIARDKIYKDALSPIDYKKYYDYIDYDIIKILIKNCIPLDIQFLYNICKSENKDKVQIAKLLLDKCNIDINACIVNNYNILHLFVLYHIDCINYYIIDLIINYGINIYSIAHTCYNIDVVELSVLYISFRNLQSIKYKGLLIYFIRKGYFRNTFIKYIGKIKSLIRIILDEIKDNDEIIDAIVNYMREKIAKRKIKNFLLKYMIYHPKSSYVNRIVMSF
jgi:hypothetical protein